MKIEDQVCTLEQALELDKLGLKAESLFYWWRWSIAEAGNTYDLCTADELESYKDNPMVYPEWYPAYTVSELLKMLPFVLRHDGNDYFVNFGHSMKGYRVIYETNKLGLIFNLDDELDREKKALFSTFRSGKVAAHVLAEYLRMLLDSNSGVLFPDDCNKRLL